MKPRTVMQRAVERVEGAGALDRPAGVIQNAVRGLLGSGTARRVLSGEPIGHPLHPALVAVPIGSWLSASVLDLTRGDATAARRIVAFGCLAAVPTAITGATDWLATDGAERRAGLVHAGLNDLALIMYVQSWRARRRGQRARGAALSLAGAGVVAASGWLGGHLAYSRGVGVAPASTT